MLCVFCNQCKEQIAWDETSHFGMRPICYSCLGDRDIKRMKTNQSIILLKSGDRLVNMSRTLSFKIKKEITHDTFTLLMFSFQKMKWRGSKFERDDRVWCRKV